MDFLRQGWLLLALSQAFTWASDIPGIVEIDLIFPRNDTYPPSGMTPIIFAIQNPSLMWSFNPSIAWSIEQQNANASDRVNTGDLIHLSNLNSSSSDPYFLYGSITHLDIEGTFQFAWTVDYDHCTQDPKTDAVTISTYSDRRYSLYFTTKNGTSPPDIVAATDEGTCHQSRAQAWNVTDLLDISESRTHRGGQSCAVLPSITPTPSPCKVKIDSPAAASISAALTAGACAVPSPKISCPAPKNAAPAVQLPIGGVRVLVMFGLLAYSLA